METKGKLVAGKPLRKRRVRPEDALQIQVVDFLRLAVKCPDRFWFCPNGGNLSTAQAGTFKRMGLTPGVHDLHFAWATGSQRQFPCFGTIELKAGKNTLTPQQEEFGADMLKLGHTWAEARSLEQVIATLKAWDFPLQAKLLPSGVIERVR